MLRLSEDRGNVAFLLRSESGELFGVYRRNAQEALSAAPLELKLTVDNPFRGLDFFETEEGRLVTFPQGRASPARRKVRSASNAAHPLVRSRSTMFR